MNNKLSILFFPTIVLIVLIIIFTMAKGHGSSNAANQSNVNTQDAVAPMNTKTSSNQNYSSNSISSNSAIIQKLISDPRFNEVQSFMYKGEIYYFASLANMKVGDPARFLFNSQGVQINCSGAPLVTNLPEICQYNPQNLTFIWKR